MVNDVSRRLCIKCATYETKYSRYVIVYVIVQMGQSIQEWTK